MIFEIDDQQMQQSQNVINNGRPMARRNVEVSFFEQDDDMDSNNSMMMNESQMPRFSSPTPASQKEQNLFMACSPPNRSNNPAVPNTPVTNALFLPFESKSFVENNLMLGNGNINTNNGNFPNSPNNMAMGNANTVFANPVQMQMQNNFMPMQMQMLNPNLMQMQMQQREGNNNGRTSPMVNVTSSSSFNPKRLTLGKPFSHDVIGAELGLLSLSPPKSLTTKTNYKFM